MNRNSCKGDINTFLILARRGESEYKLRGIIDRAPVKEVTSWVDKDGLDLLHNVIISNNVEAVEYLLRHGFFVRPHMPETNPYSHLAALLGQRAMLQVLLVNRPDDFYPSNIPIKLSERVVENVSSSVESHPDTEIKLISLDDETDSSSRPTSASKTTTTPSSRVSFGKSSRPSSSTKRPGSGTSAKRLGSASSSSSASSKLTPASKSSSSIRPESGRSSTTNQKSSSNLSTSSTKSSHTPEIPKFFIESLPTFLTNTDQTPTQSLSPLDVASRTGKLECVKVILNQCVLKHHAEDSVDGVSTQSSSDVALACVADSPKALALILHKATRDQSDWEAAVEMCLHHARAECLNILLCVAPIDTRHMFKSVNFFHVLFTSASMHGVKCYPRMALTTEVLVKHGHNVNAKMPCRTFPMYSLLTNAFCFRDYHNTSYYIQALRILLKQDANPNFDEVDFEKKHPRQAANKVIGRAPFSSALHCLLETAERYAEDMDSPELATRFIEDCASVIMGSPQANMNVVGCIGDPKSGPQVQGNILHQLAKSSVTLGAKAEIFRCVLRHGADPSVKVNEKYPVNIYFDTLFKTMKDMQRTDNRFKNSVTVSSASKRGKNGHPDNFSMENAKTILRLCGFMTPSAIKDCLRQFVKDHGKESSPMIQPYVELVKTELESRSRQVQSLVRASSWCVWRACGYRGDHVHTLKCSSELKTFILPMEF